MYHAADTRKDIAERYATIPADGSTPVGSALVSGGEIWLRSLAEIAAGYPGLVPDTIKAGAGRSAALALTDRHQRVIGAMGVAWAEPQGSPTPRRARSGSWPGWPPMPWPGRSSSRPSAPPGSAPRACSG